jgi:Ca2+-dependent lipid-binding protein
MSLDPDCFEKIGLFFSAQGLPKMDVTSQTDAFVVVYCTKKSPVANGTDSAPKLLGNTTVVKDSANPKWPDQLVIDYFFEAIQLITVKVYDQDAKALPTDLSRHELIGEASFLVTDLMCNRAHKLDLKLKGPKNMGSIEIRGEAVTNTRDVFIGTFAGAKLSNKDGFFGKSDPFLQISRMYEDGKYGVVWKNEPVMNNLSPTWPLSRIPMTKLCNGDIDRPLRVEIFDFDSSISSILMRYTGR